MKANLQPQIGLRDVPLVFLVGILSFVIHEFAHWACGELLGYDMFVGINKAGLAVGEYSQDWHFVRIDSLEQMPKRPNASSTSNLGLQQVAMSLDFSEPSDGPNSCESGYPNIKP